MTISPTQSIDSVIRLGPAYSQVLNELGFDTCCGGHETLEDNARQLGIDLPQALVALEQVSVKNPTKG